MFHTFIVIYLDIVINYDFLVEVNLLVGNRLIGFNDIFMPDKGSIRRELRGATCDGYGIFGAGALGV